MTVISIRRKENTGRHGEKEWGRKGDRKRYRVRQRVRDRGRTHENGSSYVIESQGKKRHPEVRKGKKNSSR